MALVAAGMLPLMISQSQAADFEVERELGLIVSGSYEGWFGGDFVGRFNLSDNDSTERPREDAYFVYGGEARLSLPAGEALSIQQDLKYEVNSGHFKLENASGDDVGDFNWYGLQWQSTTHVSFMRDPDTGLFGIFGGFGGGKVDSANHGIYFIGGEFQFYSGDWTFQGQGGYFDARRFRDGDNDNEHFRDAFFGRGVARWYMMPDSRFQFEASVASGINDNNNNDSEDDFLLVEWGVRYDTLVEALPLAGDTNLFVRYRGHYAQSDDPDCGGCDVNPENFTGHTIMVGANIFFGGDSRMEHERIGVALDSPDVVRWSQAGEVLD